MVRVNKMLSLNKRKKSALLARVSDSFFLAIFSVCTLVLTACGGSVQDHFSQDAPDAPAIEITADARNKWIVNIPDDISAQEYELYWDENEAFSNQNKIILDAKQVNIDIKQLLDAFVSTGQKVYVKIVALWEGKRSSSSNIIEYTVQPDGLTAVSNQSLSGSGEISWSVPDESEDSKYNIYWSTSPDVSLSNFEGSTKNLSDPIFIHDHSEYEDQQTLYYVVDRVESGVESSLSEVIQVTVNKKSTLAVPENLQAVVNGSQIEASWSAVEGAESYRLFRNTNSEFNSASVVTFASAATQYIDTGANANIDYYYWIMAVDSLGSSDLSAPVGPVRVILTGNGGVNTPPQFTIDDSFEVVEPELFITDLTATDEETNSFVFELDNNSKGLFEIDNNNRLLFKEPTDYETETTHTYSVTLWVSDGQDQTNKTITVEVKDKPEPPVVTVSTLTPSIPEGQAEVMSVESFDPEGADLVYALSGIHSDMFRFDSATETLFFKDGQVPDFESESNKDLGSEYSVTLTVSDGLDATNSIFLITVTDVDEAPVFITDANLTAPENSTDVFVAIQATDPEDTVVTYAFVRDDDKAIFELDAATGELNLNFAHDFETKPALPYQVEVSATSQGLSSSKTFVVNIADINENPEFSINAALPVAENTQQVGSVAATDPEDQAISYSIANALDGDLFQIEASSGSLSFKTGNAPDYEDPSRADHLYKLIVIADDGELQTQVDVEVEVTGVNEAPQIIESANFNAQEKTQAIRTIAVTDPDAGASLTYTITGGVDASRFNIGQFNGQLSFNLPTPNFDSPDDDNSDGIYHVQISVTDGEFTDERLFNITLSETNEAPSFTVNGPFFTIENTRDVVTLTATDPDAGDLGNLSFQLLGASTSTFVIENDNQLRFVTAPDFEAGSAVLDGNTYSVNIRLTDSINVVDETFIVNVNDDDEAPVFSAITAPFSLSEETTRNVGTVTATDPEGANVTYSLVSSVLDNNLFGIATASEVGFITFDSLPDFEQPGDTAPFNEYQLQVTATDQSGNSQTQLVIVNVDDVNEAPYFTISANQNVDEGATSPLTVTATDPEGQNVNMFVAGGADSSKFNFNTTSKELSFINPPDYEAIVDSDGNNVYEISINANDGFNSDTLNLLIEINNVNDSLPYFVTGSALSKAENDSSTIATIQVADNDNPQELAVDMIVGGDSSQFSFNEVTKQLSFISARDYENPLDANQDNEYHITLRVHDGDLGNDQLQEFIVTVSNVTNGLTKPAINAFPITTINPNQPANPFTRLFRVKRPSETAGATEFFLYYAEQSGITVGNYRTLTGGNKINIATANPYTSPSNIADGKTYYFIITAGDGNEESVASDEATATTYTPNLVLNDTGLTVCATNDLGDLTCNSAADETDLFTPQDAENGRDRLNTQGLVNKIGIGNAAFDFTKIDNNGNPLQPIETSWSCVRDNVTGKFWEVKTNTTGLHNATNTYSWYDPDDTNNNQDAGSINNGVCTGSQCDTFSFVNAVNAVGLCGKSNWRVPTLTELSTLLDYSVNVGTPTIDTNLFPHISTANSYWVYSPRSGTPGGTVTSAWSVYFDTGKTFPLVKSNDLHVRLIHD